MLAVAERGVTFGRALEIAEREQGRTVFVMAARRLQRRLNGEPGDGALEVLAQLRSDIAETERFIAEWASPDGLSLAKVTDSARAVLGGLCRCQRAVHEMPPIFLHRNQEILRRVRCE